MRSVNKMVNGLPHFSCGPIIKGFNRGSKELGTKKNLEKTGFSIL